MRIKIGFIGLGRMGRWMALNIMKAGYHLSVFDINEEAVKFVAGEGARPVRSAKELAAETDCILLSLPGTLEVENVVFGKQGIVHGARRGLVVIDCSTISYLPTLDFGKRANEKGVLFADAPVSGMEARAKDGTLTIMFGGQKEVFERFRPVLGSMGNRVIYMGALGSGQLAKLVNQLLFNISAAAIAEVLPMAAKLGLDPEKVAEVVTTGTGRSFAAEFFVPLILEGRFDKGYPLKHAYKDMVSAAEVCAHQKIPLPLVHAATTTYQMALAEGCGEQGKGAMIKVFERILGAKFRKRETT